MTGAQRLRLVLALGLVNLVLATVALGIGFQGNPAPPIAVVPNPTTATSQPGQPTRTSPPPTAAPTPTAPGSGGPQATPEPSGVAPSATPATTPEPTPSVAPSLSSAPSLAPTPAPATPRPPVIGVVVRPTKEPTPTRTPAPTKAPRPTATPAPVKTPPPVKETPKPSAKPSHGHGAKECPPRGPKGDHQASKRGRAHPPGPPWCRTVPPAHKPPKAKKDHPKDRHDHAKPTQRRDHDKRRDDHGTHETANVDSRHGPRAAHRLRTPRRAR